jgi:hypothetical protein
MNTLSTSWTSSSPRPQPATARVRLLWQHTFMSAPVSSQLV